MKKVSVSLEPSHIEALDERQAEGEVDSRSAALREVLDEYEALQEKYEDLHTECEDLREECDNLRTRLQSREDRIEQLEEQLRERSRVEEKIEDLPDQIRATGTYQERRQRLLDRASLAQRLRWKVTGVPVEEIDDDREE